MNLNTKLAEIVKKTNKKNKFSIVNSCRRLGKIRFGLDYLREFDKEVIKDDIKIIHWKYKPNLEEYELYCVSPYFSESFGDIPEYSMSG